MHSWWSASFWMPDRVLCVPVLHNVLSQLGRGQPGKGIAGAKLDAVQAASHFDIDDMHQVLLDSLLLLMARLRLSALFLLC